VPCVELLLIGSAFVLLLLSNLLNDEPAVFLLLHVKVPLIVNSVLNVVIEFVIREFAFESLIELVVSVVTDEFVRDDLGLGLEFLKQLL
jgi:hypothetical protein